MNWDFRDDGITHINIYSKGKTILGRKLSNFAYTPFDHVEDGKFQSIEGYWYWLGCKDDKLRELYGFAAKEYGRKAGAPDWMDTEEFRDKVKLAILSKVMQTPGLEQELMESKLPLTHYYVYGNVPKLVPQGDWIIVYLQELRGFLNAIKDA